MENCDDAKKQVYDDKESLEHKREIAQEGITGQVKGGSPPSCFYSAFLRLPGDAAAEVSAETVA